MNTTSAFENPNVPQRKVLGGLARLSAYPTSPRPHLDEPICAVALLDRAPRWAYDLYNLLVLPTALRNGARILFKGVGGHPLGPATGNERETLLVLSFPTAGHFLAMTSRLSFALVSPLRELSARRFSFGFVHPCIFPAFVPPRPHYHQGSPHYVARLFSLPPRDEASQDAFVRNEARRSPWDRDRVLFAGRRVAHLSVRFAGRSPRGVGAPLPFDGISLHEANEGDYLPSEDSATSNGGPEGARTPATVLRLTRVV